MPQTVAYIAWFTRAGYAAHRAADPALPLRFEQWRKNAEALQKQVEAQGLVVRRVIVECQELMAWCQREGRPVDPSARANFAAWKGTLD